MGDIVLIYIVVETSRKTAEGQGFIFFSCPYIHLHKVNKTLLSIFNDSRILLKYAKRKYLYELRMLYFVQLYGF